MRHFSDEHLIPRKRLLRFSLVFTFHGVCRESLTMDMTAPLSPKRLVVGFLDWMSLKHYKRIDDLVSVFFSLFV